MTEAKTKSVNMTFPALFSYVMNTNYRSMSGILGLVLSFGAIVMLVIGWNTTSGRQKAIFIIVALMFTVINPLSLAFKTFKQLKTSPSYKQPLVYTFGDDGIGVSQGEEHMDLEWKGVYRLLMTKYMLAVYTNRMHAFVIPLDQLGDDKGKILASVVNFTAGYKPRVSRSLRYIKEKVSAQKKPLQSAKSLRHRQSRARCIVCMVILDAARRCSRRVLVQDLA